MVYTTKLQRFKGQNHLFEVSQLIRSEVYDDKFGLSRRNSTI